MDLDLHPPALIGDPHRDLADNWIALCRELQTLEEPDALFERLDAGARGRADFLDRANQRAFLCAASETDCAADELLDEIAARLADVAEARPEYALTLCTNVTLDEDARARLLRSTQALEILDAPALRSRCEKHWRHIARHFGAYFTLSLPLIMGLLRETFASIYVDMLEAEYKDSDRRMGITVSFNRHDELLELPVVPMLRVCDLKDLLIRVLRLPATQLMRDESFRISLSYALKREGRRLDDAHSLEEAGLTAGAVVEFSTRIVYEALRRRAVAAHGGPMRAPEDPSFQQALDKFEQQYQAAWEVALAKLRPSAEPEREG